LLCSGSTYSNGSTGGSATHLHSTAVHTLTINEIPSHQHTLTSYSISSGSYETGDKSKLTYKDYQTTAWISENSSGWMNNTGGS
jgi:microcystin-dependent protein